jgi:hypothetical protein
LQFQRKNDCIVRVVPFGMPDPLVEAAVPAMQVIAAIVPADLDQASAEVESAILDPVSMAAAGCAELGLVAGMVLELIEAEHHVRHRSLPVRHQHLGQPRAQIADPRGHWRW